MPKLVSILIPTHNSGEWVAETLFSALSQSYSQIEVVVVDDGSTDDTVGVIRNVRDSRIKLIEQAANGAAGARNKALSHAQGEYIQWLDSDDLLSTQKIERQVQAIEESGSPLTLASAPFRHFYYRKESGRSRATPLWRDCGPVEFLIESFERNAWMGTPSWLMSRELTLKTGNWNAALSMDDDGEYFCRAILASRGIKFVPDVEVYYRRRARSLSFLGNSDAKMESQLASVRLQIEALLSRRDDARTRRASVMHLQHHLGCFYPDRPDLVSQSEQLATALGGTLTFPRMPTHYRWIERTLGAAAAKGLQSNYNEIKVSLHRRWDWLLHRCAGSSGH